MCLDQLCDSKYGVENSDRVKNDWDKDLKISNPRGGGGRELG